LLQFLNILFIELFPTIVSISIIGPYSKFVHPLNKSLKLLITSSGVGSTLSIVVYVKPFVCYPGKYKLLASIRYVLFKKNPEYI
jgi:hypothetical protein